MTLDIQGPDLLLTPVLRRYVEHQALLALAPFGNRVKAARIRIRRRPGETGATVCGIGVNLDPDVESSRSWVLSRAEDEEAYRAVDRAVDRIALAVGGEMAEWETRRAARVAGSQWTRPAQAG